MSVSEIQPVPGPVVSTRPSAINVQNVSLTYRTTFERVPTFKSAIIRLGRRERAVREVQAVREVSFVVPHGTTLGIIGANGAGKSTLMRMIAGILPPTEGLPPAAAFCAMMDGRWAEHGWGSRELRGGGGA